MGRHDPRPIEIAKEFVAIITPEMRRKSSTMDCFAIIAEAVVELDKQVAELRTELRALEQRTAGSQMLGSMGDIPCG